jgi:hypothetical protein
MPTPGTPRFTRSTTANRADRACRRRADARRRLRGQRHRPGRSRGPAPRIPPAACRGDPAGRCLPATWISTLGFALALATAGWSIIRGNHALAQWTGWSALAIAAAFAACLPFARTGTGHLPAIAADLWIIATVIAVIRRRTAATATADVRAKGSPPVVPDNRPLSDGSAGDCRGSQHKDQDDQKADVRTRRLHPATATASSSADATNRHHRKCDRAFEITVPAIPVDGGRVGIELDSYNL